jgi:hypothetical protein
MRIQVGKQNSRVSAIASQSILYILSFPQPPILSLDINGAGVPIVGARVLVAGARADRPSPIDDERVTRIFECRRVERGSDLLGLTYTPCSL